MHKSGFVNIIGRPNVGKSTLMNALVGERMSIITNKPQTTRHRIIGIVSDEEYQVVFSDTPGIIEDPSYKMQEMMNSYVKGTFEDADIMLFVTEPAEEYEDDDPILQRLSKIEVPLFLVINKIDMATEESVEEKTALIKEALGFAGKTFFISALAKQGLDPLKYAVMDYLDGMEDDF